MTAAFTADVAAACYKAASSSGMPPVRIALPVLALLALAACSSATPDTAPIPPPAATGRPATAVDAAILEGYVWRLGEAQPTDGRRDPRLTAAGAERLALAFSDDGLSISGACNRIFGTYRLQGDRLSVGLLAQTEIGCAAPLMDADAAISEALADPLTATLTAGPPSPVLHLRTGDGLHLRFDGEPTADTRYGSRGQVLFLEVAADRIACSHPLIPDLQCLQVRERRYGEDGLQRGEPGPWRAFHGEIEGYVHEPGIRNVLRVRRFRVADPPADASASAYVLDSVVESEMIDPP